jgi:hypothetical protein
MAHAGPQPCLGYLVIRLWIDSEPSTTVYQAYRRLANLLVWWMMVTLHRSGQVLTSDCSVYRLYPPRLKNLRASRMAGV